MHGVPQRTFYKYYSGERVAPVPTIFVGGNHEASNYCQELYYGGWVAPNIYFMGNSGVVRFGGLRIGGLSGIFKSGDYSRGYHERPPYTDGAMRSVYHVREIEVYKLLQVNGQLDIVVSHDWPRGIAHFGDTRDLLRRKKFLRKEVETNTLGSPPSELLLQALQPRYWFAAHLHCKFAAIVPHPPGTGNRSERWKSIAAAATSTTGETASSNGGNSAAAVASDTAGVPLPAGAGPPAPRVTRFLALDKCLPRREFLQVLDIPVREEEQPRNRPFCIEYDEEWLAIVRANHGLLSTRRDVVRLPAPPVLSHDDVEFVRSRVRERRSIASPGAGAPEGGGHEESTEPPTAAVPQNFVATVPPHDNNQGGGGRGKRGRARQPPQRGNPQTDEFLAMLDLPHVITIPFGEERGAPSHHREGGDRRRGGGRHGGWRADGFGTAAPSHPAAGQGPTGPVNPQRPLGATGPVPTQARFPLGPPPPPPAPVPVRDPAEIDLDDLDDGGDGAAERQHAATAQPSGAAVAGTGGDAATANPEELDIDDL